MVLIHAWPLSGQAWSPQIPALLDAGYRVISYDRATSAAVKPLNGYRYDDLAEDLHTLINVPSSSTTPHTLGFPWVVGEVARYIWCFGESRLHSVVFASSASRTTTRSMSSR